MFFISLGLRETLCAQQDLITLLKHGDKYSIDDKDVFTKFYTTFCKPANCIMKTLKVSILINIITFLLL